MILKTFDKREYWISEEDAERVAEAVSKGKKLIDLRRIGIGYLAPGSIADIIQGGQDPNIKHLPPPKAVEVDPATYERQRKIMENMRESLGQKLGWSRTKKD